MTGGDRAGLQVLLGRRPGLSPPRVRQFVIETALGVIAEGFEAEAVVIARREVSGRPPVVSSRIPPSWDGASGLTFELFGHLWNLLDAEPGPAAEAGTRPPRADLAGQRIVLDGRHGWACRQRSAAGVLVAAVVRAAPFTEVEEEALARVVRSVTMAVGSGGPDRVVEGRLSACVETDGELWRAQVVLDGSALDGSALDGRVGPGGAGGTVRRATACASTPDLALARAAAALGPKPCEVTFTGTTRLDQAVVTIVVITDADGSPLLGLSVSEGDAMVGPAEAVLAAMAALPV